MLSETSSECGIEQRRIESNVFHCKFAAERTSSRHDESHKGNQTVLDAAGPVPFSATQCA